LHPSRSRRLSAWCLVSQKTVRIGDVVVEAPTATVAFPHMLLCDFVKAITVSMEIN
jgi:hypothetical protein